MTSNTSSNNTPVQFTGKAGEYFGIWIVNLLLSIITFGIYSAWAKVRRLKYFYNNTKIDGVGFDYHAKPSAILKGRIIAFLLFVVYSVLSRFSPIAGALLGLALFLAIPWIIVRGLIFNARNTSHRGLRFDFKGKTMEAAKIFILYPLLILITFGLALPLVAQRSNKFLFENHQFGLSEFQSKALAKDFYMVYLKLLGVLVAISLVFGLLSSVLMKSLMPQVSLMPTEQLQQTQLVQQAVFKSPSDKSPADATSGFLKVANNSPEMEAALEKYLESLPPEKRAAMQEQLKALKQMQPDSAASAGKAEGNSVGKADGKDKDEEEDEDALDAKNPKDPFEAMLTSGYAKYGVMLFVFGLLGMLLYAAVIFAISAYVKSRITNLIWNNTSIEHVGFVSTQRMRDLVWLYLSNTVALIFTFGLATPWVHMRMARYKAEHLALTGEADWDKFVGEKKESAKALGGEMAEMFDVAISFG
jgi:uncharacterized membrane protein YjgN (DUF898 family)